MKYKLASILAIALVFSTQSASALLLKSGNVISPSSKTQGDAYLAGNIVQVNDEINGDAVIAGATVIINAPITQDAMIAGNKISLNKSVGDDVRIVGSTVEIKDNIKGDVIVFAQTLLIDKEVTIGGDVLAFVSTFKLDGTVEGNIQVASENSIITGKVNKDSKIQSRDITIEGILQGKTRLIATDSLEVLNQARFGNTLTYGFERELNFSQNIQGDTKVEYAPKLLEEVIQENRPDKIIFSGFLVWRILAAALVIAILMRYGYKLVKKSVKNVQTWEEALKAFGSGILVYFMPLIISILLMLTIIGIPLGVFSLVVYIGFLFFSRSITSLIVAQWLNYYFKLEAGGWQVYLMALGVYIVLFLLSFIPFFGLLIYLILSYTALGSVLIQIRK